MISNFLHLPYLASNTMMIEHSMVVSTTNKDKWHSNKKALLYSFEAFRV